MEKPISVGDLAMVFRNSPGCPMGCGPCGDLSPRGHPYPKLGQVFRVGRIWDRALCPICRNEYDVLTAQPDDGRWVAVPLARLKRIDPPADARSEDARKPVEETA